ncbi:hypothetical protein ACFYKX_26580 [Cytobacillus sp. FJAT-54145]|uniref:Type VI secretion system spike protein VgrG3-like C-terminal domain-containing protein n=1 Tax=Cytobacillus spartinae TaxID=3299023 RepID=A0ABW6KML6_9BACI
MRCGFSNTVGGLGSLSKKYESGSNGPGTIANNSGDWGGASYGTYQIATNTGTMNSFLSYLKKANPNVYKALSGHKPGSTGFNNAWSQLAKSDPKGFDSLQHGFIKQSHYDPAAYRIKENLGLDVNKYSPAVQNVLWSTAVQHGSAGATRVFREAGIKPGMSDEEIIKRVYAERGAQNGSKYFSRSSQSIRQSVVNRFQREMQDALKMLG